MRRDGAEAHSVRRDGAGPILTRPMTIPRRWKSPSPSITLPWKAKLRVRVLVRWSACRNDRSLISSRSTKGLAVCVVQRERHALLQASPTKAYGEFALTRRAAAASALPSNNSGCRLCARSSGWYILQHARQTSMSITRVSASCE